MRLRRTALLSLLSLDFSCSTIQQQAEDHSCRQDEDCAPQERCSATHGMICVSRQLPRRPSFALAGMGRIEQEGGNVEIPWEFKGCEIDLFDPATGVSRLDLRSKLRAVALSDLAYTHPYEGLCNASCAPSARCDTRNQRCAYSRHGRWTITQASRLGLAPLRVDLYQKPASHDQESDRLPSLSLLWPCGPDAPQLAELEQGASELSPLDALPPSELRRDLPTLSCQHPTRKRTRIDLSRSMLDEQPIELTAIPLHLEEETRAAYFDLSVFAGPTTGEPPLVSESLRHQLRASFSDVRQGKRFQNIHRGAGQRPVVLNHAKLRSKDPRIAAMQLELRDAEQRPSSRRREPSLRVCAPHWQLIEPEAPGVRLEHAGIAIRWDQHSPVPLLPGKMACNAHDLSEGPHVLATHCPLTQRPHLSLHAALSTRGVRDFAQEKCALPVDPSQAFELALPLHCDPQGQCRFQARSTPSAGPCFRYQISLERPASSLFRSIRRELDQEHCDSGPIKALEVGPIWERRPVIRGRVHAPGGDPTAPLRAVVMAERLQAGEAKPLGPFFFHQRVVAVGQARGQFALPVEEGRYLLTALALDPTMLGPAPFRVVDLRNGAPGVDSPQTQLELQIPTVVQVQIDAPADFTALRARPLDVGSWRSQANAHEIPDLNDPKSCFPDGRACAIRMLSAPQGERQSEIPVDYRSVLRWRSRPGGHLECKETSASADAWQAPLDGLTQSALSGTLVARHRLP